MVDDWKKRCDTNHLGHFFVDCMSKKANDICQIDAATGQEETCASVLSRSIRLAQILGKIGLVPGDPIVIGGMNHLDVHIPYYAGLISGFPAAGIDPHLKQNELKGLLNIVKPKISFCEYAMVEEYENAVQELRLDMKIVTFGGDKNSFSKFMDGQQDLQNEDEFQVAIFNTDKVSCWLASTSGSTGQPKVVALLHPHILQKYHGFLFPESKDCTRKPALNLPTLHWMSGLFNALLMPINHIKVQTSAPVTTDHVIDIINKYKARVRADTVIHLIYGMTEVGGIVLESYSEESLTLASSPKFEVKLITPETGKEILEPNVTGELLIRGPRMACYYNDPRETEILFTEDGFIKTGDLFYKNDHGRYFFVERLKMLLKYKNYQVVPPEVEEVILRHAGVADVCVTGVPHVDDGEHVVACVVRRPGHQVTADDIKELVAKNLSASKQLRGGVVFLDALPITASGKVARVAVKKLVLTAHRE